MNLKPIASNVTQLTFGDPMNPDIVVLFSYQTPVAAYISDTETYYRTSTKWSRTTTRHINSWLDGIEAKEEKQEFFNNLVK